MPRIPRPALRAGDRARARFRKAEASALAADQARSITDNPYGDRECRQDPALFLDAPTALAAAQIEESTKRDYTFTSNKRFGCRITSRISHRPRYLVQRERSSGDFKILIAVRVSLKPLLVETEFHWHLTDFIDHSAKESCGLFGVISKYRRSSFLSSFPISVIPHF